MISRRNILFVLLAMAVVIVVISMMRMMSFSEDIEQHSFSASFQRVFGTIKASKSHKQTTYIKYEDFQKENHLTTIITQTPIQSLNPDPPKEENSIHDDHQMKQRTNWELFLDDYVKRYKKQPPKYMDKWFAFAESQQCSTEHQSYARIYTDLQPFRDAFKQCVKSGNCKPSDPIISKTQLDKASMLGSSTTVKMSNGDLSATDGFGHNFVYALDRFHPYLPDNFEMTFNILDEPRVFKRAPKKREYNHAYYDETSDRWRLRTNGDITDLMDDICDKTTLNSAWKSHGFFNGPVSFEAVDHIIPVFSASSVQSCFSDIIVPSHIYMQGSEYSNWETPLPKDINDKTAWMKKKDVFHWRGSTTGGYASLKNNFTRFHRQHFVNWSHSQPRHEMAGIKLDVDFSVVHQCQKEACDIENEIYKPVGRVQNSEEKNCKYLADIDGNSFSQRILPFFRFTQSLIFKIFVFEDWITENTKPNKHYVPVKLDLSDLKEKIQWAKDNDEQARHIALEGQMHAKERLRTVDMQCYLYRLVLEYHELTLPSSTN